jgi:protein O-mannosyl-transferase
MKNVRASVPVLLLAGLTMLVYGNSLHGAFLFDDLTLVFRNAQMMHTRTFSDIVGLGGGPRPLLLFTYGLNFYMGGLNTFGYHFANVILHTINVVLVYWIISALLEHDPSKQPVAFAGAAIFSVHTLLSSAVSYIAGRSSILCATFYFAAVLLFLTGLRSKGRRTRAGYFILTALAGLFAWQSKQEAIMLPLFFAAVLFLRRETKGNHWIWIGAIAAIPFIAIGLAYHQFTSLFQNVTAAATYFRTYFTSVVFYFVPRFVVPIQLSGDPHIMPVEHWYSAQFLSSVIVLAGLGWLTIRVCRREPLFALGVTAFLVSPLMGYAAIPLADAVMEHRAYIPGLGVAILFGWLFQRTPRRPAWIVLGSVIIVFGLMTISRNMVFADPVAFWKDAAAKSPGKFRPHMNLGFAYHEAKKFPEAVREYEKALVLEPSIAAYSNLAAVYAD